MTASANIAMTDYRQVARAGRDFAIEREPVAGGEAAVLARRVARVIRRDRVFLLEPPLIDEILDKEGVAFRPPEREPSFREKPSRLVPAAVPASEVEE